MAEIRPQPGPQERFLSSSADIVVYGGAAGGGKSFSIIVDPLRHIKIKNFNAVILRRTRPELTKPGGIWDEAANLYPLIGGAANQASLEYKFKQSRIQFSAIQYETDLSQWQSAQICGIYFDELTTFTEKMFWFMGSRNRSMCGVRPYIRAGCNPVPDDDETGGWVAKLIAWWIDQQSGLPIPERSGVIRWFVRRDDVIHWADTKDELLAKFGDDAHPLSFTFIASNIHDNQILLKTNPGYLANLKALPLVEQARFLDGNWKIRPAAGKVFNREWFESWPDVRIDHEGGKLARFFDLAATQKEIKKPDPDYTASTLMLETRDKVYIVMDSKAAQLGPADVETELISTIKSDVQWARRLGIPYSARWEQEPGSAGKRESFRLTRELAGIDALGVPSRGDKLERARPLAVQAQIRNVKLREADWNDRFKNHMHAIPDANHDDIMDSATGAFDTLTQGGVGVFI